MVKKIALIGVTNVGKSSLINALLRKEICLTGDIEHLTTDIINRQIGENYLIDTPGTDITEIDDLLLKVGEVEIFLLVCDNQFDITFFRKIAQKIPREKLVLVINKRDLIKKELPSLPNIKTFLVSSLTGEGVRDLRSFLESGFSREVEGLRCLSISILGRSNVGKSSLVNIILGKNRFKTKDEIGTTRDIAAERFGSIDILDTPGYRKSKSSELMKKVQEKIEEHIKSRPFDLGLFLISAEDGFTSLDRFIVNKIMTTGVVVVCINKVDLVSGRQLQELREHIERIFSTVEIFEVCATSGLGLRKLIAGLQQRIQKTHPKIKTSTLNKAINSRGELSEVKYITQVAPYEFKVFSRRKISESKLRFMEKVVLQAMDLGGVRLKFEVIDGSSKALK